MIEFAIVLCIKQMNDTNGNKMHNMGCALNETTDLVGFPSTDNARANVSKIYYWKNFSVTQKIDYSSLVLFMGAFIIFNCVYFIHYM